MSYHGAGVQAPTVRPEAGLGAASCSFANYWDTVRGEQMIYYVTQLYKWTNTGWVLAKNTGVQYAPACGQPCLVYGLPSGKIYPETDQPGPPYWWAGAYAWNGSAWCLIGSDQNW
jgi:hypothetical protein